jgi:hypothetical protein
MTTASITDGRPGVQIAPGDHVCAFSRGDAQRDEVLVPFREAGILAGDRCICVLDSHDTEQVAKPLSLTVDVESSMRCGQLDVLPSEAAYLLDGSFSATRMLDFWEACVGVAVRNGGYTFVRAVGEMTWALRDLPGVDHLVRYEARLNQFLPRYPQAILCLYDLERFTDGQLLMEMLRTHPKVLMSGQLLDNPWYVEPVDDDALG